MHLHASPFPLRSFSIHSCRARNLFIVTGGAGAGKTTLLNALKETGLAVAPEAARAVIRAHRAIDGPAGHDRDQALFAELMLSWEIRSYEEALGAGGIRFFDRGIPELIGYWRLVGRPVPPHVQRAAHTFRYNKMVFILPPWPEIYSQDSERGQTFEEANQGYEAALRSYQETGYVLVHVPRVPVEEWRDFVRSAL